MKIDLIGIKGKVTQFEISEKIFSSKVKDKSLQHVLYSQIANSKLRMAKTKHAKTQKRYVLQDLTLKLCMFWASQHKTKKVMHVLGIAKKNKNMIEAFVLICDLVCCCCCCCWDLCDFLCEPGDPFRPCTT